MALTPTQLQAARRFAPPLFTPGQVDRRGASLRQLNPRALGYVANAGAGLAEVYPDQAGLILDSVPDFSGEMPGWRWGLSALGFAAGACLGGPIWALAGGLLGGLQ